MVYFVDNKTGVRVKPVKDPVFSEEILWFTDELGKTPTIPQADWFNMFQAEMLGLATALGVTPDKLNDGQLGVALKNAFDKVGADISKLPKVLDNLGDSRTDAASQRIVNVVNKLAKDAMQSALQANDKANQAKQESYEAKQIAQSAQDDAKEAMDEVLANIPNSKNYPSIYDLESKIKGGIAIANSENVSSKDLGNIYLGNLTYDGYEFNAFTALNALTNQARFNCSFGQLFSLKSSLVNPFIQKMGINFMGDSNMWGSGTGQHITGSPRTGDLNDARDHFASNSTVNLFKRYIGKKYFNDLEPILSNYKGSPSGESICTYKKEIVLFPYDDEGFKKTRGIPSNLNIVTEKWAGTKTGWRRVFVYNKYDTKQANLEFKFTGEKFGIYFSRSPISINLDIYINDKRVTTIIGEAKETSRQNYEEITFDYVKDATIRFEASRNNTENTTTGFYLEAISIEKTVIIQNNGITGASASSFNDKCIDDGIEKYDNFALLQFGGNDRVTSVDYVSRSISGFMHSMNEMIRKLKSSNVSPILISTNPGNLRSGQIFTRQDSALAMNQLAIENQLDIIDNYSVFLGSNVDMYTNDGTHLNILGTSIASRNIIAAIESSSLSTSLEPKTLRDDTSN